MLSVRDYMSQDVLSMEEGASVIDIARKMAEHGIGSIVITKNQVPVGIVTEADMTRRVVAAGRDPQAAVSTVMSSPLYHTNPDADIFHVASTLKQHKIKKLPVLSGERLVGIITQTDFIRHMFKSLRELHVSYIKGRIGSGKFQEEALKLINQVKDIQEGKNWHMHCASCGYSFMDPEKDGSLLIKNCPACHSDKIAYDKHPML